MAVGRPSLITLGYASGIFFGSKRHTGSIVGRSRKILKTLVVGQPGPLLFAPLKFELVYCHQLYQNLQPWLLNQFHVHTETQKGLWIGVFLKLNLGLGINLELNLNLNTKLNARRYTLDLQWLIRRLMMKCFLDIIMNVECNNMINT